jgi:hypothetical protein
VAKRNHLDEVTRAAVEAARGRADLHKAIRRAVASGESLRTVAAAASLSHEQVRRIAND